MTTYVDSDYVADHLWIRSPVLDGRRESGGGLNAAMFFLDQARKELQAIEIALGTDVAGTQATLLARLAKRLSPEGIPKGYMAWGEPRLWYRVDSSSPTATAREFQFGRSALKTAGTASASVSFAATFSSIPGFVLAQFCCGTHGSTTRLGQAQVEIVSVSTTAFTYHAKAWTAGGTWGTPDQDYRIQWMAGVIA